MDEQNQTPRTINPQPNTAATEAQPNINSIGNTNVPPTAPAPIMSANSMGLGVNSKDHSFNWKKVLGIGMGIVLLGVLVFISMKVLKPNSTSTLKSYTVSQSSPPFSVKFYLGAKVTQKNNLTYLVSTDSQSKQSTIYLVPLSSPASCAGQVPFTFQFNGQSTQGCYRSDKVIYAGSVQVSGREYLISLAAQKPISLQDAKAIFNSVSIQQ